MWRTDYHHTHNQIGTLIKDSQQTIYSFLCVKEHAGWLPDYQSIANKTKILIWFFTIYKYIR